MEEPRDTITPVKVSFDVATHWHQSIKLARLWTSLDKVKTIIENECIPLGAHLGIDDTDLMSALDNAVDAIVNHVTTFRLQASRKER
jgi:hypothetical protein